MKEYAVGAIVGALLIMAVMRRSRDPPVVPQPRRVTLPPVLNSPPSSVATAFAGRGVPADLVAALARAPSAPQKEADFGEDAVVLSLSPETAKSLAMQAVDAVNKVSQGILHFIAADTAFSMVSGVKRVIFTAYAPKSNVTIKLVATFHQGELIYLRPYSSVPDTLDPPATPDLAASTFACFKPIVSNPGPCT